MCSLCEGVKWIDGLCPFECFISRTVKTDLVKILIGNLYYSVGKIEFCVYQPSINFALCI